MDVQYITSAAKPHQLPASELPEIAFIGRSNSGKSSLINAVTGRRKIARTGRTPGQTTMANFFLVNDKIFLVDLPGYGFAAADTAVRRHWQALVDRYFTRPNIMYIIALIDARRGLQDDDIALFRMIGSEVAIILALTKADKLSRAEQKKSLEKMKKDLAAHKVPIGEVVMTSTLKGTGIKELQEILFPKS